LNHLTRTVRWQPAPTDSAFESIPSEMHDTAARDLAAPVKIYSAGSPSCRTADRMPSLTHYRDSLAQNSES
jgi:hypothetical protein